MKLAVITDNNYYCNGFKKCNPSILPPVFSGTLSGLESARAGAFSGTLTLTVVYR
ncbi:hypothetical protein ACU769_005582 [Klebsiella variicola]|uniref:hypothetical protein n=1 Tax=Klebsiella variicola TaxID=244366 RepID=UPI0009D3927A|nr:hypothetical protein [Klebsiella variicola]HCB0793749.1 hypothetical protein [Klebsiella variicola subsp. variicola]EIW9274533.1 hypothetical protein [Klebsiella variicola]ELC9130620.1 hypothetical protein [Klebsiella variicola]UVW55710.1 hypothetical protein NYO12_29220 [Klebsiella variicola]SLV35737.1 Uncharacterised protein [Klebsiella variicola]